LRKKKILVNLSAYNAKKIACILTSAMDNQSSRFNVVNFMKIFLDDFGIFLGRKRNRFVVKREAEKRDRGQRC